jgi:hypothetical protein
VAPLAQVAAAAAATAAEAEAVAAAPAAQYKHQHHLEGSKSGQPGQLWRTQQRARQQRQDGHTSAQSHHDVASEADVQHNTTPCHDTMVHHIGNMLCCAGALHVGWLSQHSSVCCGFIHGCASCRNTSYSRSALVL